MANHKYYIIKYDDVYVSHFLEMKTISLGGLAKLKALEKIEVKNFLNRSSLEDWDSRSYYNSRL